MPRLKWTSAAIVAIALAALPAEPGCGRKEAKPPPAGPAAKLVFWHIMNYPGPREIIENAVRKFEAAHPAVKVDVQTFENDAYKTKLSIEMAGGTPPDVFFTWGGGGLASLAEAGRALDLTAALNEGGWRERFLPQPLSFCTCGGKVYAVPLDLSCVPVWYNADLFAEHGLQPPRTFGELTALCKEFRRKGVTPIALGNREQWPGGLCFAYLAVRAGGAALFLDAARGARDSLFNDPAFVRAGELVQQLVECKAFSAGFNGIDEGQARTQFLNGAAAMCVTGTWLVARVKEERPEFLAKLKCFPFPAVEQGMGGATTIVGGINCAFAVSSSCKSPGAAIELLRFLTAEEVGAAWCGIGRIPAMRVNAEALARLPAPTQSALQLLRAADAVQPYYDQYLPPRLAEEHKKTTQALFALTLKPAEAAERMEQCAREWFKRPAK